MAYYNHCTLMGYLTDDPKFKMIAGGKCVCSFTLAVKNSGKRGKVYSNFIPVSCWNRNARNIAKYVKKGQQLLVDGSLAQGRWKDHTGQTQSRIELMCTTFRFTGKKGDWVDGEETQPDACGETEECDGLADGRDQGPLAEQRGETEEPGTVPVD